MGGVSGIGWATAKLLALMRAKVVIADINENSGHDAAAKLNETGGSSVFVRADVSKTGDVAALIETTLSSFGSLDILMHFAGIGLEQVALETTEENWERLISVNLTGSFLMLKAAGAAMVENGYGRIVAMSSIAGVRGGTGRTAYGASKGGVAAMVRVMAVEWASRGVTVYALAPGAIETTLVRKMHDAET